MKESKLYKLYVNIQGLDNETDTLANIVLEISCLFMHSLAANLH